MHLQRLKSSTALVLLTIIFQIHESTEDEVESIKGNLNAAVASSSNSNSYQQSNAEGSALLAAPINKRKTEPESDEEMHMMKGKQADQKRRRNKKIRPQPGLEDSLSMKSKNRSRQKQSQKNKKPQNVKPKWVGSDHMSNLPLGIIENAGENESPSKTISHNEDSEADPTTPNIPIFSSEESKSKQSFVFSGSQHKLVPVKPSNKEEDKLSPEEKAIFESLQNTLMRENGADIPEFIPDAKDSPHYPDPGTDSKSKVWDAKSNNADHFDDGRTTKSQKGMDQNDDTVPTGAVSPNSDDADGEIMEYESRGMGEESGDDTLVQSKHNQTKDRCPRPVHLWNGTKSMWIDFKNGKSWSHSFSVLEKSASSVMHSMVSCSKSIWKGFKSLMGLKKRSAPSDSLSAIEPSSEMHGVDVEAFVEKKRSAPQETSVSSPESHTPRERQRRSGPKIR